MTSKRAGLLLLLLIAGCSHKPPYEGRSVAELERMLDDPDPKTQVQGAYGLSQHGAEAASAVPALVRSLRSPEPLVRQQAALARGKIGVAEEAVPALAAVLSDSEWTVRRQAALRRGRSEGRPAPPRPTCAAAATIRIRESARPSRKRWPRSATHLPPNRAEPHFFPRRGLDTLRQVVVV